jgi:hypothetical protein
MTGTDHWTPQDKLDRWHLALDATTRDSLAGKIIRRHRPVVELGRGVSCARCSRGKMLRGWPCADTVDALMEVERDG